MSPPAAPRARQSPWVMAWLLGWIALTAWGLAGVVQGPLSRLWDTADPPSPDQFVFYNYRLNGGFAGMPVEIGDYDGDGNTDLALAPMGATSGSDGSRFVAGEVYVYRGDGTLSGGVDRGQFTDANFPGLTIYGARSADFMGTELYSADVNGDGVRDLLVGAQNYDGPLNDRATCGGVFVILGGEDRLATGSVIDLNFDPASPPEGVTTIVGERPGDRLGIWVEAGDLDGDGFDDVVVGADQSSGASTDDASERVGMVTVIYGRETFPAIIDLQAPGEVSAISRIYGRDARDHFGASVHARDLDGDGRDELIAAASLNRLSAFQPDLPREFPAEGYEGGDGPQNDRSRAGEVYVVFSVPDAPRLPDIVDLGSPLEPAFASRLGIVHGEGPGDVAGEEITSGDFDGDGEMDLALGALTASNPRGDTWAGATYVLYSARHLRGEELDLAALDTGGAIDGLTVSRLYGSEDNLIFGDTLSVGDFNRDGFDDLAIGVPHWTIGDKVEAGEVAVFFGRPEPFPDNFIAQIEIPDERVLIAYVRGPDRADNFSYSMEAFDYDGDGYDDLFPNAMRGDGADNNAVDAGEGYVVSGFHLSGERVEVTSFEPQDAALGETVEVTIHGRGFTVEADTEVRVGDRLATDVHVENGRRLTATFPPSDEPLAATVTVENRHGAATAGAVFRYGEPSGTEFVRGNANGDVDNVVDISDAIHSLEYQFLGATTGCLDAHDVDDNGTVEITDAILLLEHLFLGEEPPPPPFPEPGLDPTADELACS